MFSKLQLGYLKDLRIQSVSESEQHIRASITDLNVEPKPENWDKFIPKFLTNNLAEYDHHYILGEVIVKKISDLRPK